MTPIRCLIVDDEPLAVDLIEDFIDKISVLSLVGKCYNSAEALPYLVSGTVDAVFLDINMPGLNGLLLAELIPRDIKVIFTTAYAEHAVASYEKNAIDYLLKPVTFDRFLKSVAKLNKIQQPVASLKSPDSPEDTVLFVKSGKKILQLNLTEVIYIEAMKDYAVFHLPNGKIVTGRTFKELEAILPDFLQRIHLSYFVNLSKISKIEDNQVHIGNVSLNISGKYREAFMKKIVGSLL